MGGSNHKQLAPLLAFHVGAFNHSVCSILLALSVVWTSGGRFRNDASVWGKN